MPTEQPGPARGAGLLRAYALLMGTQLVDVKDFPGFTQEDAIKIAIHRLTQQGYRDIEPLPAQPMRAVDGLWRLSFRVADPTHP